MKNPFLFLVLSLFSISLNAQTIISSSSSFTQSDADGLSWPITITGGTISTPVVITLAEDVLLEQSNKYFIIQSEYVTFDGNSHTITIDNVSGYPGLLQNGDGSTNGYSFVTINNVWVLSNSTILIDGGGWIGQTYFAYNATNVTFNNCYSDGDISSFGGGITGTNSSCTVMNSHTSGAIIYASGGIFGAYSDGVAIKCFSAGDQGDYCGGIFGYSCTGTGSASDCYSTGIIGSYGGGIFGYFSNAIASNCYSTGAISLYGGGIAGSQNTGSIENCYSSGTIGESAGGIFGVYSYSGSATNCYSTGSIGVNAGGITGEGNDISVTNCYSTGIIDPAGGGINGVNNTGATTNSFAEGTGTWNDDNAKDYLTGEDGSIFTDIDLVSSSVPYKLSSFNASIYSPDNASVSENTSSNFVAGNFTTGNYSIISITGNPAGYSSLSIDAGTGMVSVSTSIAGTYVLNIIYSDISDGSYQINNFTLDVLSTLPVAWRSFTVVPRGNAAWLQWSTASEQNTRDFNVQHSIDGSNWTTISTLAAAGNSTAISNYSYLHADPVRGNNYYRIQQTDLDGKYIYSSVRQLQVALSNKGFSVLNTLVSNGVLEVEVKASSTLYLYNNDGKLIWQKQFNAGLQIIDCSAVPKGMYFLKGKDAVEKIVVR